MTHPDIDGRRPGRSSDEHDLQNWSIRPVIDDPAVEARMRKAIRRFAPARRSSKQE